MTDPDFADRTYIEPLTPEVLARIIERERPDAVLPTLGGQTGAQRRHGAVRAGPDRRARHAGDDRRQRRGDRHRRGPRAVQGGDGRHRPRRARRRASPTRSTRRAPSLDEIGLPVIIRPAYILGGRGTGIAHTAGRVRPPRRRRPRGQPDRRDPRRGVDRRLEGVRARGDARPRRQLRDHLLDRERRPDGRAHRRLDHRRPGPDADRRRVPADARRRLRLHPPRRRRDRWLERAVRPRPGDRPAGRHRDEPAGVALVGAGLEGDRLPDRQDRRPPRRRLHARRDPQRRHAGDAGQLRAGHRLRRHEDPALGVREAARHVRRPRHADAVGRRGDGHRADVPREPAEGAALAGARAASGSTATRPRASWPAVDDAELLAAIAVPTPDRVFQIGELLRRGVDRRAHPRGLPHRRLVPRPDAGDRRGAPRARRARTARPRSTPARGGGPSGSGSATPSWPTCGTPTRAPCATPGEAAGVAPDVQDRRHVRRRVRRRDAVPLLDVGGRERGPPVGPAAGRHPRLRAQPHRPGHRVRLLLRPRQLRPAARPASRR